MKTRNGMTILNDVGAWDVMRGMNWPWDYCATGTAAGNASGLQDWFARHGEYFVSLANCRKCAAEVQRYNRKNELAAGSGFGESTIG